MRGRASASYFNREAREWAPNFSPTQIRMETPVNYGILAATVAVLSLASPLVGTASAQKSHPVEHMNSCNQAIGGMKFEGWPADRMREMMMNSCLNNNGVVPGAQAEHQSQHEQKPVSLKQKKHSAPAR